MDGDLFQGVLLGLLALGLIVLVALLATLGGIRKALEQRASEPTAGPETVSRLETGYGAPLHEESPATAQPASTAQAPASAGTSGGAQASTIRGVLEQHGLHDAQPAATQAPATQEPAPQEQAVDSVFAAHADDPQEEPFQRDGRWWFRRGDELLLYDEATGQWQPAPEGAGGAAAPAAGGAAGAQTQPVSTTTQAAPAVADAVATYWKCPTCGAVNGSTAATCRMCFAARP